ncbi:MAG: zinc-dependent alcohol dehydrogenase [Spirochaetota bacterium]
MNIPKTMRAVVLTARNKTEIREIDVPAPGPGEVLIEVAACAVCSTDISLMNNPGPGQPAFGDFIPGHEYSGTVAALGEHVDEVSIGDRVAVEVHYGCGRCSNCRNGNYTSCLNWGDTHKGHRANGMTSPGGFAEYAVNHVSTVYKIPDEVSFDEASLITNLGCVLYGFELTGGYIIGDSVVVIGDGPLGLLSAQVAKVLGADSVCLTGLNDYRMGIARDLGIDWVVDVKTQNPLELLKSSFNTGVDLAVEASGSQQGMSAAFRLPKWTGKVLLLGIPAGEVSLDMHEFARGNKYLYTVRGEGWTNCGRAVSLLKNDRIDLKPLITHRFELNHFDEAVRVHRTEEINSIKVIVNP